VDKPAIDVIRRDRDVVLERIRSYHLRPFPGVVGKVFLISDQYPGVWLEHVYDAIAWVDYDRGDPAVSRSQVDLFLGHQKPDGQLPCLVLDPVLGKDWPIGPVGHGWLQECVSFTRLCLEASEQNGDAQLLARAYAQCVRWDAWLVRNRMTLGRGLIETFCGYDTGHDFSMRFDDVRYPTAGSGDGAAPPTGCAVLPMISPDLNAVFYGSRAALAEMARRLGKSEEAAAWTAAAEAVRRSLHEVCFDEADEFFYDVDRHGHRRRIRSVAITNLFGEGVLDRHLADRIFARYLAHPAEFGSPYPFPAVSMADRAWIQNRTGNSWTFYSQGLTALRALRWMDAYGRGSELERMMWAWVSAWCRSGTVRFGQELHPVTGEPSDASPWYSSTMLFFLHAVRRLGIIA